MRVSYTSFWPGFDGNLSWFAAAIRESGTEHYSVAPDEAPDVVFQCAMTLSDFAGKYGPVGAGGPLRVFYTGEATPPDLTRSHCAVSFTRRSAPNLYRLPLFVMYHDDPEAAFATPLGMRHPHLKLCSALASNPAPGSPRLEFAGKLHAAGMLRAGGSAFPADLGPMAVGRGPGDKRRFLGDCMFHMAFENTVMEGYVTEKIADALAAGTVPVYWGDPRVTEDFGRDSMILLPEAGPWESHVERLARIMSDRNAYEALRAAPKMPESGFPNYWSKAAFMRWLFLMLDAHFGNSPLPIPD
jgi:hypothetical protein